MGTPYRELAVVDDMTIRPIDRIERHRRYGSSIIAVSSLLPAAIVSLSPSMTVVGTVSLMLVNIWLIGVGLVMRYTKTQCAACGARDLDERWDAIARPERHGWIYFSYRCSRCKEQRRLE